ncbi:MAG: hypothetical protein ACE5HX_03760 [bacterium]
MSFCFHLFCIQEFGENLSQSKDFSINLIEPKITADVLWKYAEYEEKKKNYEMAMFFLGQFLRVAKPPQERAKARAKILALASKYEQNYNSKGKVKPLYNWIKIDINYLILIITIQFIFILGLLLFFIKKRLFKSRPIKIDSDVVNDNIGTVNNKNNFLSKRAPCADKDFIDLKLLHKRKGFRF